MLSKPVEKTTYVSLAPGFIPGPSSGVRAAPSCDRQDPQNSGLTACVRYSPFESFTMSLEESDDLNIPDAALVDPVLEASSLPKFDMHLYKSSLTESHVKYLVKLYGISEDLHLRVAPEVINMAEFLRLPDFKGCKVSVGALLPPGTVRVTHLASHAERLEDVPPKTSDMMVFEIPCRKVRDDKEKKKKRAEEKAATKVPAANIQDGMVVNKDAGRDGPHKKKRVRIGPQVQTGSEHVSSPTPLNHAKPLEALAIEEHVSPPLSAGRHGDNEGDLSGLQTRPSPAHHSCRRLDTVEEPAHENVMPKVETSYSVGRFGTTLRPCLRLRVLQRCEGSLQGVQKELAAIQSAYDEKASTYEQLFKSYDGALTREKSLQDRLEELKEEKKEAGQLNSSQADRIKQLEEALKQSETIAHQLRVEKERYTVKASRGDGEATDCESIPPYFCASATPECSEYKWSLGEVFSLVVGKAS
uniref:Transposase (Putative), gypsy type n=1 Tax=Tanacetum cinerariifolium TaxID=118510 RepID=A0A699HMH9_TANCI|nr:hypothetical protein [Tanacetum cinerariifolium]